MLIKGELSAEDTLTCILGVLETEQVAGVVEPFLRLAGLVAGKYTPIDEILERRHQVADRAAVLAANPDLRTGALQSLAANAVTAEHFAQLDEAAARRLRPGLAGRRRPAPPAAATTPRRSSSCSSATPTPTPPSTP